MIVKRRFLSVSFFFSFSSLPAVSCMLASSVALQKLAEVYSWSALDYTFSSDEHRTYALERGEFVPENNLPVGIEVHKNKLFVTVPRWKNGNLRCFWVGFSRRLPSGPGSWT